jgi:hypothetical protein
MRLPTQTELDRIMAHGPTYLWTRCRSNGRVDAELDLLQMPNDASSDILQDWISDWLRHYIAYHTEVIGLVLGAIFGGSLFGGIHCLAWNAHFPTPTEKLIWRISSVMTAALPVLSTPVTARWVKSTGGFSDKERVSVVATLLTGAFIIPYILARLFLIVEMFRSLFFLPPEAFVST